MPRPRSPFHPYRKPPLTIPDILAWADEFYRRTGRWPRLRDGPVAGGPGTTWHAVDAALKAGLRGLPGGSPRAARRVVAGHAPGNDAVGRPVTVTTPDGATTTVVYDPSGLIIGRRRPGNAGPRDERVGHRHRPAVGVVRGGRGSGTSLATYAYSFDAAGRLTAATDSGATTSYGYDAAGQLTAAGAATYSYDPAGNRTDPGYATGTGNRLGTDGVWTYTYDNAGAVTGKTDAAGDAWAYGYDNAGQLVSAAYTPAGAGSPTQVGTYAYDAFGNQVSAAETAGGTTTVTRTGLDGWNPAGAGAAVGTENFVAWADLDGSNALTARRVFDTGTAAPVAGETAAGVVSWYATDRLGSVRVVLDNTGSVTGTAAYDAFGVLASGSRADRYGYTGQAWDGLLGLQANGNGRRAYDPATGRWQQPDPLGFGAGDPNLYRYVGNDPTGFTDPSGLDGLGPPVALPPAIHSLPPNPADLPSVKSPPSSTTRGQASTRRTSGYVGITATGRKIPAADPYEAQYLTYIGQFDGRSATTETLYTLGRGTYNITAAPIVSSAIKTQIFFSDLANSAYDPYYQPIDNTVRNFFNDPSLNNWALATVGATGDATVVAATGSIVLRGPVTRVTQGITDKAGSLSAVSEDTLLNTEPIRLGQWDSQVAPRPPWWDSTWTWEPASGEGNASWRWWDPHGGEWRWHSVDPWHPTGHWDYNPWIHPNNPWLNIHPIGDKWAYVP